MNVLQISDTLRINDFDEKQYTIERKHVVAKGKDAGAVKWVPQSYCGSVKALPTLLKRIIIGDATMEASTKARAKAEALFDASGIEQQILALPEKGNSK